MSLRANRPPKHSNPRPASLNQQRKLAQVGFVFGLISWAMTCTVDSAQAQSTPLQSDQRAAQVAPDVELAAALLIKQAQDIKMAVLKAGAASYRRQAQAYAVSSLHADGLLAYEPTLQALTPTNTTTPPDPQPSRFDRIVRTTAFTPWGRAEVPDDVLLVLDVAAPVCEHINQRLYGQATLTTGGNPIDLGEGVILQQPAAWKQRAEGCLRRAAAAASWVYYKVIVAR